MVLLPWTAFPQPKHEKLTADVWEQAVNLPSIHKLQTERKKKKITTQNLGKDARGKGKKIIIQDQNHAPESIFSWLLLQL